MAHVEVDQYSIRVYDSYEIKDALKASGYKFDSGLSSDQRPYWFKLFVRMDDAQAEIELLESLNVEFTSILENETLRVFALDNLVNCADRSIDWV